MSKPESDMSLAELPPAYYRKLGPPPKLPRPPETPIPTIPELPGYCTEENPQSNVPLAELPLREEYRGLEPPPDTPVPTIPELLSYCTEENPQDRHYPMGLPYPRESPVFWIKYGRYPWNSVPAQVMAYHGLRKIGSPVRAPGLFYACELANHETYMVMEYIPGQTAAQLLEGTKEPAGREAIYRKVALALHQLNRIPVPPNSRPAAIDGEQIWHILFMDQIAPRHYENADQLEQHLNLWLKITKRKGEVRGLSKEPMVFCQSDAYLGNFMIDQQGNVVAIDFAITSILPSSFSKYSIPSIYSHDGYPIREWADVPSTDGIDNVAALSASFAPMVMGSSSFASCGRRIPGASWTPEPPCNDDGRITTPPVFYDKTWLD